MNLAGLAQAFIMLFVIFDAVGNVPAFHAFTQQMTAHEKRRVARQSVIVAGAVLVAFTLLGKALFSAINVSIDDFKVAAGIVLFILSVELVLGKLEPGMRKVEAEDFAIVPLATPLLAGPGSISTVMYLSEVVGLAETLTSIALNVVVAYAIFASSEAIFKALGRNGVRAVTRIIGLIIAAIAVSIIREGLQRILH
ncbi:MAG: MarC family protein [Candidatus Nezhaarchaeota archaeon]|nr:MarC family protein [Candidatus Nezhaarchaeota archaeon]